MSCQTGALMPGRHHFVGYTASLAPPDGRHNLPCDQRDTHAKPNTRHEVTAARAGCPSGRTVLNSFSTKIKLHLFRASIRVKH
jgi:hypothetical protein